MPAGTPLRVTTGASQEQVDEDLAIAQTYGNVLEEYRYHPEAKFLGADGRACR